MEIKIPTFFIKISLTTFLIFILLSSLSFFIIVDNNTLVKSTITSLFNIDIIIDLSKSQVLNFIKSILALSSPKKSFKSPICTFSLISIHEKDYQYSDI